MSTNAIGKRNWKNYSCQSFANDLFTKIDTTGVNDPSLNVQACWNVIENVIVNVIDKHAPMVNFVNTTPKRKSFYSSNVIKCKLRKRKRLLRQDKLNNGHANAIAIRSLNTEIRSHFKNCKISSVKQAALGNGGNIWKAVKAAKNLNHDTLPNAFTLGGVPVATCHTAQKFAEFFHNKVKTAVGKSRVDHNNVYNGKCQLIVQNGNFMTVNDVKECLISLSNKKCEGYDPIPLCAIADAKLVLLNPLVTLFNKVCSTQKIPEQWKEAKVILVFKNGNVNQMENYCVSIA